MPDVRPLPRIHMHSDNAGYALLLRPEVLVARYESVVLRSENRVHYEALRAALVPHQPSRYRGFSRSPLEALPTSDPELLLLIGGSEPERSATQRFSQLLAPPPDDSYTVDHLLPSLEDALEVYGLLEQPDRYEIVHLARNEETRDERTLGFDVGYWGGDHFSILADSAVVPTWHPPDPASFGTLREALGNLTPSFLFPTAEAAKAYRSFYLTQSWAESEDYPGQFTVVRVNAA
jgi:hypothetical protein